MSESIEPLTCSRCGLADTSVTRADNGVPRHLTPTTCIAALREALQHAKKLHS